MHALIEDQIYILELELSMEAKRRNVAEGKANTYIIIVLLLNR